MYADDPNPLNKHRRRSSGRSRRPIEPSGAPRGVTPFTSLCLGMLVGVGPGALAAYQLLPSSWFPNEWVQVQSAGAGPEKPERVIEFPELDGVGSRAEGTPTSQYQKKAWRVIETLEKHPTPGRASKVK